MSGFSAEWLDLRAPADAAARALEVLEAVRRYEATRPGRQVTDIGAGVGANSV